MKDNVMPAFVSGLASRKKNICFFFKFIKWSKQCSFW